MQWTVENFNKIVMTKVALPDDEDDDEDWTDKHVVKALPLRDTSIYVKTIRWKGTCMKEFTKFQTKIYTVKCGQGYCETSPNSMAEVSNSKFCSKGASTKNVGYYYRTVFPNVYGGSKWCFKTPGGFLNGAVVMMDGKIVAQVDADKWSAEKQSESLDFCMTLTKGNHVLEVFGASKTDYTSSWTF
jgi:hypothetical protein